MKTKLIIFALMLGVLVFSCKKDEDEEPIAFFPAEIATVKNKLAASIDSLNNSLTIVAGQIAQNGIDSNFIRGKLLELYTGSTFSKEFCYITTAGVLEIIEPPAYYSYQGTDISTQAHVIASFGSKQPALSNAFYVVEGYWATVDLHPIVNNSTLLGGICSVFAPQEILGRIITPVVNNQSFEMWVMEKDGVVLYDQDTAEVGLNVLTDPMYAAFPELITACQKIAANKSGETTYSFYQSGTSTVVTKKTYWDTYYYHDKEWKIIWVKPM
jgi:hypothetical protein